MRVYRRAEKIYITAPGGTTQRREYPTVKQAKQAHDSIIWALGLASTTVDTFKTKCAYAHKEISRLKKVGSNK